MNRHVIVHLPSPPRAIVTLDFRAGADVAFIHGKTLYRPAWPFSIGPPLPQCLNWAQFVAQKPLDRQSQFVTFHPVRLGPQVTPPACLFRNQACSAETADYDLVIGVVMEAIKTHSR